MHHQQWHDGWGGNGWGWIPMVIMMVLFWGGLVWLGLTLLRRTGHPASFAHGVPAPPVPPAPPVRPDPAAILAERLAHGEIDPEDYRQRLAALQGAGTAPAAGTVPQQPPGD